jgi:hypothetical protein
VVLRVVSPFGDPTTRLSRPNPDPSDILASPSVAPLIVVPVRLLSETTTDHTTESEREEVDTSFDDSGTLVHNLNELSSLIIHC